MSNGSSALAPATLGASSPPVAAIARRSMRRTIERRLLLGIALALLVGGTIIDRLLEPQIIDLFDQRLVGMASAMRSNIEQETDGIDVDLPNGLLLAFRRERDPVAFQLWDDDGALLGRSDADDPPVLERRPTIIDQPTFDTRRLADGAGLRVMHLSFMPEPDSNDDGEPVAFPPGFEFRPVHLTLAGPAAPLEHQLWQLRATLLAVAILLLTATVVYIRVSLRAGFAPLNDIRAQIARSGAAGEPARLTLPEGGAELAEVVDQLNALLDQLSRTLQRERQFSHDVAHELRTPLAELKAVIDVGSRWPGDTRLSARLYEDARQASAQMEQIVNNLLALARSEQGRDLIDLTPFDLIDVIQRAWRSASIVHGVANDHPAPLISAQHCTLAGGRDQWLLILQNLFGNVFAHGDRPPEASIDLRVEGARLRLCITNRASSLTADDARHLFDRLWRKDCARADTRHAGLGLALVQAYAALLDIGVEARIERGSLEIILTASNAL
ncbi:MAG: histidine kinase dimerization/phospho-acceptor domain-containing protein [Burkholderiaceae bacterium]